MLPSDFYADFIVLFSPPSIRCLTLYFSGYSIQNVIRQTGIDRSSCAVKRILFDPVYLGDEYYPPMIDQQTHEDLLKERQKRYEAQGCFKSSRQAAPAPILSSFTYIGDPASVPSSLSPAEKAQTIYAMIQPVEGGAA